MCFFYYLCAMNDVQQPLNDFTPALLKWFDAYGRELPWRQTRDPYAVWL